MNDEAETRIVEKAEYVEEAVTVLSRKQSLDRNGYVDDREQRDIVEREFQTAIEACIDIAQLLLTADGVAVPETNAEAFAQLEGADRLTAETADAMKEAARFRNVLAHTYGHEIDDEHVYRHLQEDLDWFPTYLREVRGALDMSEQ
jgi:uncharacterized protein YutE (UPF0331/DUF86 family)